NLIFEIGAPGRRAATMPEMDVPTESPESMIPEGMLRKEPAPLPEVSEIEIVRHYTHLSQRNFGVDTGFYPLGSCTMKYNPKLNEDMAALPGFAHIHPLQPDSTVQGAIQLFYELEQYLAEIAGMARVTLQPSAGAHGELTGLMLIKAFHENNGQGHRNLVLIPDNAHGTNPASATLADYRSVEIKTDPRTGGIEIEHLKEVLDEHAANVAAIMMTDPNTLGLFDSKVVEIAQMVHEAGGQLYYDGANANAVLGITRPGDMGFDVVHFNLHKTCSTPHGGGGPGSGPIGVKEHLVPFLPGPLPEKVDNGYYWADPGPRSIGKVRANKGNFGVLVRAYTYIRTYGPDGLLHVAQSAILNANYLRHELASDYEIAYPEMCQHEFVATAERQKEEYGVTALDIAKRILDFGMYAPTIYFPLIVHEALMIEPTETETRETLDYFVSVMHQIAEEARTDPEIVKTAPHTTPVGRLDQALAARRPNLRWAPGQEETH
ncbi:MAG TPA: aminomethyl-transferring glycine dehydrogenase subunit GcvPB, partial [Ktedonobacteraceae bacterium]|nr:aminomethyl-transferring glycine dehydrogenase subunit GcvPB [Ktedonobacteraceae bacterium]